VSQTTQLFLRKQHIDGKGKVLFERGMSECRETYLTEITSKIGDGLHGTPKNKDNGENFFIKCNNLGVHWVLLFLLQFLLKNIGTLYCKKYNKQSSYPLFH
jgi:hypothetical protein